MHLQENVDMKKLTMDSRIRDLYATDTGHDILAKLCMQAGISTKWIDNPVIRNLKLKALQKPLHKVLDPGFFTALLQLINEHTEQRLPEKKDITHTWWKEAVFYQIYPRTFNHGTIQGIREKLDYLKSLGVDAVWLSPVYDSPMDDNGYDIRDYRKIAEQFGTMEDFDALLNGIHAHGMKLIMDLVVNHTSDEHRFFQEAMKDKHSPYHDYYYLVPDKAHTNNWSSFFSGSAWSQYDNGEYGLHLFARKQVDLNWDNPSLRHDVSDMVSWWLDKGVDGFRLDVINYISKDSGLPDGDESIGKLIGYQGIEHYYYGPHLHEYLHELHESAFARHNAFSVGECPGAGMAMASSLTDERRKELDMIFSFDHLETPGHVRFEDYQYDLNFLRDYLIDWQMHYGSACWMSLFYNNHDNPRMVSKIDPSGQYRREICCLLALMQLSLKGTPFIYQGDEMGLGNVPFGGIDELQDIESLNYYREHVGKGEKESQVWQTVLAGTRDHARVPLPWNETEAQYGQKIDPMVTRVYRQWTGLRHRHKCLVYGTFEVLSKKKNRFVYRREDENESWIIDCNLSVHETEPWHVSDAYELVYPETVRGSALGAYGVRAWYQNKGSAIMENKDTEKERK